MISTRLRTFAAALAHPALVIVTAACIVAPTHAQTPAQDFPNRQIRWIVPYAPGGGGDSVARQYGHRMESALRQPLIIDNRPGGSTVIGISALLQAPADGYTILEGNDQLATNPLLMDKVPYKLDDFVGISVLMKGELALVSRPDFPAQSLAEALRYIKTSDGRLAFGSWGIGGTAHLAMESLLDRIGARMVHVPFQGAAPSINAMLSGQLDIMFTDLGTANPFIKTGKLKLWAIGSKERHPSFTDTPTIAEAGYPDFDWFSWLGVVGKKGMPAQAQARIQAAVRAAIDDKEFMQEQLDKGNRPWGSTSKEFDDLLTNSTAAAKAIIDKRGIRLQ